MEKVWKKKGIAFLLSAVFLLGGCGAEAQPSEEGDTAAFPEELYTEEYTLEDALAEEMVPLAGSPSSGVLQAPKASGTVVYQDSGNKGVVLDASNVSDGYVMVKYTGTSPARKKVIIQGPSGVKYTYNLNKKNEYETFILSDGNGQYTVGVYQNVEGTKYSTLFTKSIQVRLSDEFEPFLRPNQYVNFTEKSQVVALAKKLTSTTTDDLKKVQIIYDYVVENITYDKKKAATVQSGYLPNVDQILNLKKGICFDYAAVMAAMLRSQGIPTKLVTGYTGNVYHAWISTYTKETGWVEGIIFFDGTSWKLMDPTFASSNNSSDAIMKYISNTNNYKEKYLY